MPTGDLELTGEPEDPKKNPVKGYAAAPGGGPAGEKCGTCAHAYKRGGGVRSYWKCDLVVPTGGPGTDIRLKSLACWRWQPIGTEVTCRRCRGKKSIRMVVDYLKKTMHYEDKQCPECLGTGRWKAE